MNKRPFILGLVWLTMLTSTLQAQDFFGWANSFGNSNDNEVNDIAVDDNGNVYMVGLLEGTIDFDPSGLTKNLTPSGARAAFLAKYDKDGLLVWEKKLEVDNVTDIFSTGGSILVFGTFVNTATIDTQTFTNPLSTTAKASFLAGFSPTDGSLLGAGSFPSSGDQETFDIKEKGGFIYLAGSFQGSIDLGSALTAAESTQRGSTKDFFMMRVNNLGGIDWAKTVATNGAANRIDEIELDEDGGLYIGGILREDLDFDAGTNLAAAFSLNQGFVTKLDTAGTFGWFRRTRRPAGNSLATATVNSLEIDKAGNVSATGFVMFGATLDGFSSALTIGNSTRDLLFMKYAPNGDGLEFKTIGDPGTLAGVSHAIDDQGNYIFLGTGTNADNDFDLGSGVHSVGFGTGERDIFVAKYDSLFNLQWADGFTGNMVIDRATSLVEKEGFIYIGGYHQGGIDVEFGSGSTVLSSQGGRDMLLAKLNSVSIFNQTVNLCDQDALQVGNSVYSQPGTYQDLFPATTANDQDSVVNTTILSVLPAISLSVDLTPVSCPGESTGAVTVTASDIATRDYQYAIDGSTFQTSREFTGLAAGSYTITVKDGDNCYATINFDILAPPAFSGSIDVTDNVCAGGTSGQIIATVTGGTGPYTYSIDGVNFQVANFFPNLASGNYTITAKDANDCTVTGVATVGEPAALVPMEDTIFAPSCVGAADGVLDIFATGGTGPYQFSIDGTNFSASGRFNDLAAGEYTVTVRDANQCTASASFMVVDPVPVTVAEANMLPVDCRGDATGIIEVVASGGASGYEYSIDGTNFQTSAIFTGLAAGDYTFTARDANGCTGTVTLTMTEPQAFAISSTVTPVTCRGDNNATLTIDSVTGGTAPYQYSLNGGTFGTDLVYSNLAVGSYTLTVRDANGCTTTRGYDVTEPPAITASIASTVNADCNGAATGAITVAFSGGHGGFTYSLDGNNFQASATFAGLTAGSYTINAKDQFGCTAQVTTSITEPTALSLPFEKTDISCFGESNGQITGLASGGTAPYTYSLDGTNFQTGTFSGLNAGSYTLTVKDANECTATVNVSLTEPAVLTFGGTGTTNVTCFGGADGMITVNGMGGTAPYTYSIDGSDFQEDNVFSGLSAGTYTFTVKDANGCTDTRDFSVNQQPELTTSVVSTDVLCTGDASGVVSITASGGVMPYTYSIDGSTFQNSNEFTGLVAGNYTIVLKDALDCTMNTTVTINEPDPLTVTATLIDDNTITATGAGGTGPYQYAIDGTTFQTSGTFSNLSNGNYIITVRDANGCTATVNSSLIVTSIDLPGQLPVVNSYPNPVKDELIISEVKAGDVISLIDLNGQQLNEIRVIKSQRDYPLSVRAIKEGMFLLKIKDQQGRRKLVKKMIRSY